MKMKDRKQWYEKNERLNKNVTLKRGMEVKDVDGHTGVVVEIVYGHHPHKHGYIAVWQNNRVGYGADNCEHYAYFGWERNLRITDYNE